MSDILFEQIGRLGLVTLNRPKSLNALTLDMCRQHHKQIRIWDQKPDIAAILIRGAGGRAFCAGGDVVDLYHLCKDSGDKGQEEWEGFFADEYRMNHATSNLRKTYISLVDGIFMGGGVGISVHGPVRIAGDTSRFAMPETGIGMIPDVGGTYLLSQMPGAIGTYLGLVGAHLKTSDCLYSGVVTHYIPTDRHEDLIDQLAYGSQDVMALVDGLAADPGPASMLELRPGIDRVFAHDSMEKIMESLAKEDMIENDWNVSVQKTIERLSPISLKLTLEAIRIARGQSLMQCLINEYRIVCAIRCGHDFFEGIRAQLVDKDRKPCWSPASIENVTQEMLAPYFAPPASGDLIIDESTTT